MTLRKLSLFILLMSVSFEPCRGVLNSLPGHYKIRRISPEGGLDSNGYRDARQDKLGFIWVITVNDLFRFDGYSFKRYTGKLPPISPDGGWEFRQIEIDHSGNVYVATRNGLLRYNALLDCFDQLLNEPVTLVEEDTRNRLWVKASALGLFHPESLSFTPVLCDNGNVLKNVTAIHCSQTSICVGDEAGNLYLLDESKSVFEKQSVSVPQSILDIRHSHNRFYVLTENEGMFEFSASLDSLHAHYTFFYPGGDHRVSARALYIDRFGSIWITTQRGAYVYDPGRGDYSHYTYERTNEYGLPSNSIWRLNEDNYGNLLIGTYSGGLAIMNFEERRAFQSYNARGDDLSFQVVSSFAEDDRFVWIGTEGGGLNRMNKQTGEFAYYTNKRNKNSLSYDNIRSLLTMGNLLCIGMSRGGLDWFDKTTGKFTHISARQAGKPLVNDHVNRMVSSGDTLLWISYLSGGGSLTSYSMKQKKFVHYALDNREEYKTAVTSINDFCLNPKGSLWIASNFLFCFNPVSLTLESVDSTRQLNIQTLAFDSIRNTLWMGTKGNGLYVYHPQNRRFKQMLELSKYGAYTISSLAMDCFGNIWLGTDNGLFRFNPSTGQVLQFNKDDGTQGLIYYSQAAYTQSNGNLLFGGNEGFTMVNPRLVSSNELKPSVIISDFFIDNRSVVPASLPNVSESGVAAMSGLTLEHTQNNFGFEFASTNFVSSLKNRFKYRLVGYMNEWIEVDAFQRRVYYAHIPPGSYCFEVITANNDGLWGEPRSIDIRVKTPLWAAWWAISLYILLAVMVGGAAIRYFHERRKFKLQLYLDQIEKQQSEHNHQEQLRFFTNVSHDFRTPLSLILAAVEYIKSLEISSKYLSILETNSHRLLSLVNELMDFRMVQNGKLTPSYVKGNWNLFVEQTIKGFKELARQQEIRFSFEPDLTMGSPIAFDPKIMEKIILNLLNNSYKYTSIGGAIRVMTFAHRADFVSSHTTHYTPGSVLLQTEPSFLLVISDTGVGVSETSIAHVFDRYFRVEDSQSDRHIGSGIGLALVKNLVQLIGGEISIYSERGRGTDMVVAFPLPDMDHLPEVMFSSAPKDCFASEIITGDFCLENDDSFGYSLHEKKILVVEDNEELRKLLVDLLSPCYLVIEAQNGEEALRMTEDQFPDLILSDVMMPRMDGIEMCSRIKSDIKTSHIPVVLLTAKADMESRIEGVDTGANLYLEKPVNGKLLLSSLSNQLKYLQQVKEYCSKNHFAESSHLALSRRDREFMQQLTQLLDSFLIDPSLDVDRLADGLAMSRSTLYNKIKALTGKSIVEFVRSYRLQYAARLLVQEELSIQLVMERVGILSQAHFSRSFKKEFGELPSEYMARMKKRGLRA